MLASVVERCFCRHNHNAFMWCFAAEVHDDEDRESVATKVGLVISDASNRGGSCDSKAACGREDRILRKVHFRNSTPDNSVSVR